MTDAPSRREVAISAALFTLTVLTASLSYAVFFVDGDVLSDPSLLLRPERLESGLAFGGSLLTILLAHELGHWFVARRHGFALTLPYFVPFPSLFGTLGAVIRLRSLPRSRQALLEMGIAGPLAGAVVAFGLLAVALRWTTPAPSELPAGLYTIFEDPLAVRLLGLLTTGAPPDRLGSYHPIAMAGWVGCFLTGVNLLPVGQLDGGHVFNAAFPGIARRFSRYAPFALLGAGLLLWPGWAVWGVLLFVLRANVPLPVADEPPLPLRSRVLFAAAVLLFALTFLPIPMVEESIGP